MKFYGVCLFQRLFQIDDDSYYKAGNYFIYLSLFLWSQNEFLKVV